MRTVFYLLLLIHLLPIFSWPAAASEGSLGAMRQTFLQAEHYIKQNRDDDYLALSDTLIDYPLYPYLHYQWLTKHLNDSIAVREFLRQYPDTRYAALLHNQWLRYLGEKQQWLTVIREYKTGNDSELRCYVGQAQYRLGQQQQALETAKQFWLSGKSYSTACNPLFDWLQHAPGFTSDLIWQRLITALSHNNVHLAKQMQRLLPPAQRNAAEDWLQLHQRPQEVQNRTSGKPNDARAAALFAHAIRRWADSDPDAALRTWEAKKQHFDLSAKLVTDTEKRLGMELAFKRDKRAYSLLQKHAGDDTSAQEWRVRAALSQQNWQHVLSALDALDQELKQQDKWQYWRAKASAATGNNQAAQAIFGELAKQRSFYGFMAATQLQQSIALNHHPVRISAKELSAIQNSKAFRVVSELLNIERRAEATRQWWHAVTQLDDHGKKMAAKLAEKWQWPSMAIFTIAKAKYWDDTELRFPLAFKQLVQSQAHRQQLDPSLIFGLIRQESAFDQFAGSPAGAMGLMQVMPQTAKSIAKDFNERWHNQFNLLTPELNIKYGSAYFKKMLKRYDGHYALAIAAYNAGPGRVNQWLPKNRHLPADIWIETIPYKETRNYVSSVIMYAMIYQQRLSGNSLKMPVLLADVRPG